MRILREIRDELRAIRVLLEDAEKREIARDGVNGARWEKLPSGKLVLNNFRQRSGLR